MSLSATDSTEERFLVIDDHEAILEGTVPALKRSYPTAEIRTAQDVQTARTQLEYYYPTLVVIDLSLPEKPHAPASPEVGMQFLTTLIESKLAPNILVLSTNIKPLVQLKPMINAYEGGFVAMDKSLPIREMVRLIDFALRGSIYLPPQLRSRSEFDRKWLEVLRLKFHEGLIDKAIAERMQVSERTIRNYWIRLQDALGVSDEPNKELRIQIEIAARKLGLIS
ncbi:response regulator receiver domain protein (plasmid) [Scytonema sp. HK-05]|uniref:response regulator transcription factor n=1 Tax=Scytonema sp. HK-05 TaxID=1137095 RepID=UPI0009377A86|nr:response regulator transcription factor [Scytonema sp. HK-05]OKH57060.1 response regulator receiver protein [Scytonema sp. HK-05]BAY50245.1 response regulator receiver domain protein [Scytonema sp. HK-05]